MANELNYDETVSIVADVEKSGEESKTVVLSVKDALKEKVDIKQYYGKDAEKTADMVASLVPLNPSEEEKKETPAPQKKRWGLGRGAAKQQNAKGAEQPNKEVGTMDKYAENAASDLSRVMPHRQAARKEQDEVTASTGMVMPTLSLQDQVAELERIGLGLDGNVFNSEQLKLIRMEVGALRQNSKAEKVPDENSLAAIRNRKLDEIEAKLASTGVG